MDSLINKLEDLLAAKFEEADFADCFLLEIKVLPGNRIEVYLDSDTGITLEKCTRISRYLECYLDETGWAGSSYVLEVSSPGVSRPLTLPRQYPKHVGRWLAVQLARGERVEGKLLEVSAQGLVLEVEVPQDQQKNDKKKKARMIKKACRISFAEINEARVLVRF